VDDERCCGILNRSLPQAVFLQNHQIMKAVLPLILIAIMLTSAEAQLEKQISREVEAIMYGTMADYSGVKFYPASGSGSGSGLGVDSDGGYVPKPVVQVTDSVVFDAFAKHTEWRDVLVVCDWTGSMYQYGAQVLRWHKLNLDRGTNIIKHLVFFNDGDDKLNPGKEKQIGATGGIYHVDPNNIEDLLAKIESAVAGGDGGEIEENNLEAVLAGIEAYKGNYKTIVLIADSKSWIRDMELLSRINEPVHIILCDKGGYATDYLKVAKHTGGSVYSARDEIDFSAALGSMSARVTFQGKAYDL
jgi:hypothetical protein